MQIETITVEQIGEQFSIDGAYVDSYPLGTGHIQDTYFAVYEKMGVEKKFVFQRVNDNVFADPERLMENVLKVTQHISGKMKKYHDMNYNRYCLQILPAGDGRSFVVDPDGKYWRCFPFIDGAKTCEIVETQSQANIVGAAFGRFQKLLSDLPGSCLFETIPDFHNTPKRYAAFEKAVAKDRCQRVNGCKDIISFARNRKEITSTIIDLLFHGHLPVRITHNDTKLNNILLDSDSGDALCVIDLDTVMPGTVLYDFGDMVRTSTCIAAEDEKNLEKVYLHLNLFESLAKGYLLETKSFLTDNERNNLVFSGELMTFEQGIRFLTDYLQGDTYYKTAYAEHNLDRCRNQFKLVRSIEEHEQEMKKIVNRNWRLI